MTEYTRGPWTVGAGNNKGWEILGSSSTDGTELWFAEVWTSEADATLIAAAPDLLAELKTLARVCEGVCHGWPGGDPFAAIARARALIAKAEGQNA